ncbi:transcription antitermination factor NusB [Candidatus Dojkabacteria bacterium HGW-Dojkabacteria-1]|uniref:Transcription antitermination protein NusB n=1 Tax=Candidatus Dojkabacteria bacterium HGW-Dojkabacteria-1 TaxID=2013761 RepID=A0A2N2F426_9BACT|nr:MAG: transcription antitermination factor NusB [Candidatus Dojkabacteria bacterium HGW-Dojkabacteria-1]
MKKATDPRHLSRELALQTLFSKDFNGTKDGVIDFEVSDLSEIDEIEDYNKDLYNDIVNGVPQKKEEIDQVITQFAPQWPISQMKLVDLQILRIAIYEGFLAKITPPKVAIDEAIEIAKEFGGDTSSKFVNGVLGAIYEINKQEDDKSDK